MVHTHLAHPFSIPLFQVRLSSLLLPPHWTSNCVRPIPMAFLQALLCWAAKPPPTIPLGHHKYHHFLLFSLEGKWDSARRDRALPENIWRCLETYWIVVSELGGVCLAPSRDQGCCYVSYFKGQPFSPPRESTHNAGIKGCQVL